VKQYKKLTYNALPPFASDFQETEIQKF